MLHVTRLLLFPGIYKQPSEPTMTLRVQTSTHRACLLCVTWRLARVNPFHQTHLSQRPGGYRTQVCCSYWLNQTESTAETRLLSGKWLPPLSCWLQTCPCGFQVQSRGLLGFVWSMSVEISLVTWTWWWCVRSTLRKWLTSACRCKAPRLRECTRASGGCARLRGCTTEVRSIPDI